MPRKENMVVIPEMPMFDKHEASINNLVPTNKEAGLDSNDDIRETLDNIVYLWRDHAGVVSKTYKRLTDANSAESVPVQERNDASEYTAATREKWEDVRSTIQAAIDKQKVEWDKVKLSSENSVDLFTEDRRKNEQAIALLEAIQETTDLNLKPEEMRQRIAQWIFEEIFIEATYRMYGYSAAEVGEDIPDLTTQDPLEEEKSEIISAFHRKPWDKKKKKENSKTYRAWRKLILSEDNSVDPDEVYDIFEDLWQAANGEGVTRKSALHYLQIGEDIYQGLQKGEAFNIELADYWDEEDGGDEEGDSEE